MFGTKKRGVPPVKKRKRKRKKQNPWRPLVEELVEKKKTKCEFCEVEQYCDVFPDRHGSGKPTKFGHYHGGIFRKKNVPGFGESKWVISAHVLADWNVGDLKHPEKYIASCIAHLNYCSLVSPKTQRVYKRPKYGIFDETPIHFQFLRDVYGHGKGMAVILIINEKRSPSFWGTGISRSQIVKLEFRGRPAGN